MFLCVNLQLKWNIGSSSCTLTYLQCPYVIYIFKIMKDLVYIARNFCCFILCFQLKRHSYNNSHTIRSSWHCFHSLNLSSGKWPGNRNTFPSSGDSTLLATKGLSAPKLNINHRFLQKQVECFSRLNFRPFATC